jgi:hypothetical protein
MTCFRSAFYPIFVFTLGSFPVVAQKLPPLPKPVQALAQGYATECRELGGRGFAIGKPIPANPEDYLGNRDFDRDGKASFAEAVNFTNDGQPDYIVTPQFIQCSAFGASYFDAGQIPNNHFVVSTPSGYVTETLSSLDVRLDKRDDRDVAVLSTAGPGAYERLFDEYVYGWDGRNMATLEYYKGGRRVDNKGKVWDTVANPSNRWAVAPATASGAAGAYVGGPQAMNAILLRCNADGTVGMFAAAAGQRMNQPLTATFTSPLSGANVDAVLRYDSKIKGFAGVASSALIDLFSGNDTMLDIRLNGKASGRMSTLGSTKAIREALGTCLGLSSPSTPAVAATTTATAGAPLPPLGLAAGYYVDEGTSCTDPIEAFYYDGKRAGVIFADEGFPPDPLGKVTKQGGEYFLPNAEILVKVLGPTRVQLTIQDTGGPMRLCPTAQIPQSIRRLVK